MVRKSPWIDKPRMSSSLGDARLVSSRLSREGSTVMGRVLAFESGGARVEFPADAPVSEGWGPTDGGVSAVGALVRVLIGADGRIMMIASPDSLPEGASPVATGVTGEAALDAAASASEAHAAASATQQALDQAQAQLDVAMSRINDPDTGLDASQSKADDAMFAAVQATQKATTAASVAASKSRTFTTTPAPPYAAGDLYRNGNKVYICTTARSSGSYTASDWTLTADKTSENTAADTSKVNGTSSATVIQNIATALANGKPFIQQSTPSATAVGQLWFPTDSAGRVIGMKVSTATGTGSWQTYLMMAGQILVPGSVGTTEIGPDGVTAANIKASNELWAKIAAFAEVTTDMLIAGNATITNSMIVDKLAGKSIYGAYLEGGELLIQGTDEAATPTTGTYTTFETASDVNVWAVALSSSGVSRDSAGKSGYCVKGISTASESGGTYTIRSALNTKYLNTLSAWNFPACPYDGITTVSAWVKSSVADTLTVAWFDFQNANGDAISVSKTVEVAANAWTLVQLVGPTGYRPTPSNNPLLPTFMVLGQKVASSQGATRTLWVDQVTWSNVADTSSAVHVYRDALGSPCVEVIDYQGKVRAKLAAPSSKPAGLTFYADDGEYVLSADGLRSGTQSVPWVDAIMSAKAGTVAVPAYTLESAGNEYSFYANVIVTMPFAPPPGYQFALQIHRGTVFTSSMMVISADTAHQTVGIMFSSTRQDARVTELAWQLIPL